MSGPIYRGQRRRFNCGVFWCVPLLTTVLSP